ncbi:MAG: hypothetical protein M1827_002761 [Pycnora praestabilis]|nr:MAG: hypothetical protein M1827_002761 [Pycnora praestabilis]
MPDTSSVLVRTYHPRDNTAVLSLFSIGIMELAPIAFRQQLTNPRLFFIPLILSQPLLLYYSGYLLPDVAWWQFVAGWVAGCAMSVEAFRRWIRRDISRYVGMSLRTDLRDIPAYYGLSPPPEGEGKDDGAWQAKGISNFWVCEIGGEVVGCVALDHAPSSPTAELRRMTVSSSYRRRGIGNAMLSNLKIWAREHNSIPVVLSTTTAQQPALEMYRRAGWRETGRKSILPLVMYEIYYRLDWK